MSFPCFWRSGLNWNYCWVLEFPHSRKLETQYSHFNCLALEQGQTGRVFQLRVGFGYWKNISGRVGSGRVGYRVFVSNTKSIGYYGVLKSWSGIRRVSPLFPILSNIYYLIWLIWSIKHVFGRHIYVIVVQCGRSWQPFGDRRKSHKPLESAHLQNFATKMPYL